MDNHAGPSDYASIPRPTRIKMKETKPEKAHRLYRREQRRLARENERISRANGYAVSPPRSTNYRDESMSPPRHAAKKSRYDEGDEDRGAGGSGEWMGGYGRRAREELERREWNEKMAWMAQDSNFEHDPWGDAGYAEDLHIPRRFREAARGYSASAPARGMSGRNAMAEVEMEGGTVPPLGSMTESEYSTFIREGMYRLKHRAEIEEAEKRRKAKEEAERRKEAEREKARKEEEKRIRKLKQLKSEDEERLKKEERKKFWERWKSLTEVGGEIEVCQISFKDIPWPIHRFISASKARHAELSIDDLTLSSVRSFLIALASDEKQEERKVVREAIRLFHPDRFHGRILPRVKASEQELVKQGVESVSRILNDLASEAK